MYVPFIPRPPDGPLALEPARPSDADRPFDVVLPDALGHPSLGFREGIWFRVGPGHPPQRIGARTAILGHPDAAGPIVQIMCWWMREHPGHGQSVDLSTELALLVAEMTRDLGAQRAALHAR